MQTVKKPSSSSTLAPAQLYKYQWRVDLLIEKLETMQPLELVDGSFVTMIYDKNVIENIRNKGKVELKSAVDLITRYRLSDLKKTAEFGGGPGQGAGSALTKLTECAQAVYAQARWIDAEIAEAYQWAKVDETFDGIAQGLPVDWKESCLLGAGTLHDNFGEKDYTFHRGSSWVEELESTFKRLNANEKQFSNLNKWSPADIYMLSEAGTEIDVTEANSIAELNDILSKALEAKDIIGVSLKLIRKEAKISYVNFGAMRKARTNLEKFTTGKDFFSSKDANLYFSDGGRIQFRTFPKTFQGEIKGKLANHGKIGYGPIQTILKQLGIEQMIDIKKLRKLILAEDHDMLLSFFKNYNRYACDDVKVNLNAFIEKCKEKGGEWLFSKICCLHLLDIIVSNNRQSEFVTACIQYASSSSDLSAPFVKLE